MYDDFLAPNTPFAAGQYCSGQCQTRRDSDVRQLLGPTRATGVSVVIDMMRAWAIKRPPTLPRSFVRVQIWLFRRLEEVIDASADDPTMTKEEPASSSVHSGKK